MFYYSGVIFGKICFSRYFYECEYNVYHFNSSRLFYRYSICRYFIVFYETRCVTVVLMNASGLANASERSERVFVIERAELKHQRTSFVQCFMLGHSYLFFLHNKSIRFIQFIHYSCSIALAASLRRLVHLRCGLRTETADWNGDVDSELVEF